VETDDDYIRLHGGPDKGSLPGLVKKLGLGAGSYLNTAALLTVGSYSLAQ